MYSYRDIPREAASRAARIHLDALDKLVARHGMGGKRGGQRVFSIRDLVIANTARALAGPPITLAHALAVAAPLLVDEPADDTVLILTDDGRSWIQLREDDWPRTSFRLIPVGQFRKDMEARLAMAI